MHWTHSFTIHRLRKHALIKSAMQCYCIAVLCSAKLLGYRLVWTAHEHLPHDDNFADPARLNRTISRLADAVIVHSKTTLTQLARVDVWVATPSVIPHGNYVRAYPADVSRTTARSKLQLGTHELAILFFGLIQGYKGVEQLIDAVHSIGDPDVRLIVAGACHDPQLREQLSLLSSAGNITLYPRRIPDSEVATFFRACDVVCLPFREISTSGSAMLALSFGRPLIAPRLGALADLPARVGWLYDPRRPGALEAAVRQAISGRDLLEARGEAAEEYAKRLSWDAIADQTYGVFRTVLERRSGPVVALRGHSRQDNTDRNLRVSPDEVMPHVRGSRCGLRAGCEPHERKV